MEPWQRFSAAVGLPPAAIAAAAAAVLVAVVGIALWIRSRRRSPVRRALDKDAVPSAGVALERPTAPLARGLSRTRAGLLQRLLPVLARDRLDPASVAEL